MPFDNIKKQRKYFCFFTFGPEQAVQELFSSPKQTMTKWVDVKKATADPME
jgi:hypothetical protein